MANNIIITANWADGTLSNGMLSRQYDNNRYVVQFTNYPLGEDEDLSLYLIVWMKTEENGQSVEQAPIELESDQWIITNYYTQFVQSMQFQLCVRNESGTFEAHSPIFNGNVTKSLSHDGSTQEIYVNPLFDPYREYVDELVVGAGAVVIDPDLDTAGAAADAKATGDAITDLNERLDDISEVSVADGKLVIDGVEYEIGGRGITSIAKTGMSGLVDTYTILFTDGTSTTFTVTNGDASDAKIQGFIENWLEAHPEATTTVQDGAVTMDKLSTDVKSQLGTRANHNYKYNNSQAEGTSTFIELFQKVKNEVMDEYKGNIDKIPIILCTDQHGALTGSKALFDAINSCVNWYDISKFFNLGDTVSSNYGTYSASTDEFTTNGTLENAITALSSIPMDKQVNIFGNHDTWCLKSGETGYKMLPQNLLSPYFRNAQGHRKANAGYFSIKDDYFNVKYVVVSGFEYIGGVGVNVGTESASTEQINWLIDELGKDDGYDIVMVCHEPLFPDWAGRSYESQMVKVASSVNNSNRWAWLNTDEIFLARKRKSSGTFTDRSGVVHTFDYSDAKTKLLCGIDGHLHYDCSQYTGNDEFLCESFGCFKHNDGDFIYFLLIDRENSRLNIWKIDTVNLAYENYQVPFAIPTTAETYTIRRRLKNVTTYQISNTIREGQAFFDKLTPASGYTIGTVKVLMGGTDVTATAYDSTTQKIYIASVTGDIDITAYDSTTSSNAKVWVVTNELQNTEVNKGTVYSDEIYLKPICVSDGVSYSETIKAKALTGFNIYELSAKMGDTDITDTLTSSRGIITLSATVTDDIEVVCKACPITYTQGVVTGDGTIDATNTSYGTVSYVPIDGRIIGSIKCDPSILGDTVYIAFYDENYDFIKRIYASTGRTIAVYVPAAARYMRVSLPYDSRYQNYVPLPSTVINTVSVTATATGLTLGEYSNSIRQGESITIPFTYVEEGTIIVNTCTAGGTTVPYTIGENSITIPYTPGNVVLDMYVRPRTLYELANETTLTNETSTINVRPMASVDYSFTIMLDFTLVDATANGAKIFSNNNGSSGFQIRRRLAGINKVAVSYAGTEYEESDLAVAKGTRCKIIVTHVGGMNSFDTKCYLKTAAVDTPVEHTITSSSTASTAGRRVYDGDIILGSTIGTVTYHNLKILSEVATAEEIASFLSFD